MTELFSVRNSEKEVCSIRMFIIQENSIFTIRTYHANDLTFFGIIIRMYYAPKEHNPPHIHVYYQEYTAVVNIEDGMMTLGHLPTKQYKLVAAWIEIHRDDLMANWNLCQNGEKPFNINPLN